MRMMIVKMRKRRKKWNKWNRMGLCMSQRISMAIGRITLRRSSSKRKWL